MGMGMEADALHPSRNVVDVGKECQALLMSPALGQASSLNASTFDLDG